MRNILNTRITLGDLISIYIGFLIGNLIPTEPTITWIEALIN